VSRFLRGLWRPRYAVSACLLLVLLGVGGFVGGRALQYRRHLAAARAAFDDQDCDEARPHVAACLRLCPDSAEAHLVAARGLRRAGFYDEAAEHLDQCQRLGGATSDVVLEWAMLHAQQGELPDHEMFLMAKVRDGAPESGLILEALAAGSIHVYRLGPALHYLDELLAREPDNALGLIWRGWLYETQGRDLDALESYRAAVRARPRQPEARLHLARLDLKRDELAEAEEHLEYLHRRGYKTMEVLAALGRCRRQQGDLPGARALLDEVLAASADDADALKERGRVALDEGDAERAERLLRRAVELVPQDRVALYHLSKALTQLGNVREADEYAARLAKVEAEMKLLEDLYKKMSTVPADPKLRCEAGMICLRNGQDREALRWLSGAVQLDPTYAPAHEGLAEYYDRADQPALAAQHRRLAGRASGGRQPPGDGKPGG